MKNKQKKYIVYASETVFYEFEIKAQSKEEAEDAIYSGEVEVGDAQDSNGFQIDKIELTK